VPAGVPLTKGQIAFCSDRSSRWDWQIYCMNGDGSGVLRLTQDPDSAGMFSNLNFFIFTGFAWSHDGAKIAYCSQSLKTIAFADSRGIELGYVGKGTSKSSLVYPAWSPDDARVAGSTIETLFWAKADGTGIALLTDPIEGGTGYQRHPRWSPDGKRIAFRLDCLVTGLGIVEVDTKRLTIVSNKTTDQLTRPYLYPPCMVELDPPDEYGGAPTWHPAGTGVVFSAYDGNNWQLFRVNQNGNDLRQLTSIPYATTRLRYAATHPEYSPDGSRIVFMVGSNIYVMNPDGSGLTRLTSTDQDAFPTWSPDGTRIAFASHRDGNWEIYVMNADGANQTNITNNPADDVYPLWRPRK